MEHLESQIAEWRLHIERAAAIHNIDVAELESHLRDQISELQDAGLAEDEAFLVAVKRMGKRDEISREFAREHSGRLWHQMVTDGDIEDPTNKGLFEAVAFACVAGVLAQITYRLALNADHANVVSRNVSFVVLPVLAGFFAWRRELKLKQFLLILTPFLFSAAVINLYPYDHNAFTEILVATHLPIALWFVVAFPYMGGALKSHERRMDFVRFSGEWFIYYVLIALGGGVLTALTMLILTPTGISSESIAGWILPTGAAGAVVIAAWLVECKQQVIENMAPVLTMVFSPLFALMLVVSVVTYAITGFSKAFDRDLIGVFDALLVVVFGLVLYAMSARRPSTNPTLMDRIQLIAVTCALLLDVMVLGSMVGRIGGLGFTPNRATALGFNIVLLVNLAGTAWLSAKFIRGQGTFHQLERWQTTYLPVFAVWAAIVVLAFPPLFSFQ